MAVAPGPPANLTAAVDFGRVALAWTAPGTGDAATGYTVETGSSPGQVQVRSFTGSTTPSLTMGLWPGTYFMRVRATNAVGESPPSNEVTVTTSAVPSGPTNLVFAVTGTSASFSWTASASGTPTYLLEAGSASGWTDLALVPIGGTPAYSVPSVPTGTFFIRVRASFGLFGVSVPSNEVVLTYPVPVVAPGVPRNLINSVSGNTVSLSWQPAAIGGAPDTYLLDAWVAGGSNVAAGAPVGAGLTYSTGGVPDGTYYVRVRAQNRGGTSAPSNETTIVVGTPVIAPGPPTGLAFTTGPGGGVTLAWVAPATGSAPTGYVIDAGSATGLSNFATLPVGPATTFSTSGVPPGAYFVRVRAVNAAGSSGPSNEIVVVVP